MDDLSGKKILIMGIAGGLAQILARLILKHYPDAKIIGVDSRKVSNCEVLPGLECRQIKYSRGNFENLFRSNEFDVVFHLARISHSRSSQDALAKRLSLNVMGTNTILDLCLRFEVKKVVILSTFHIYGAYPDNPVFLTEDSPARASIKHAELRDVVEMDQICTNWMWKNQNSIETVVLRPCNIIGSQIRNAISLFLSSPMPIIPLDYNPMYQFIHEFDMAEILYHSVEQLPTGIYNVATDDYISLRDAVRSLGGEGIPVPLFAANALNHFLKVVPDYFIDYLKYPCLIDNSALKKHLPKHYYRFSAEDALAQIKLT